MLYDDILNRCRQMFLDNRTIDEILAFCRKNGGTKIDCIRILTELRDLPLDECKEIVHNSQAWSDVKASDDEFHDLLEKALTNDEDDTESKD